MSAARNKQIGILEKTHATLARLTTALDDAALDFRFAPDEWNIREILAHLVDDEMYVMRTRLERMIKEDRPDLAPHDEKHWHAHRNKTRDDIEELLTDFDLQRRASLGILGMLRESDWAREGYQPEIGVFNAEEWLSHWVEHDTVHIKQIESTIEIYYKQTIS